MMEKYELAQLVGTLLLTHSLWWPWTVFATEAGMPTVSATKPRLSVWIALVGLLMYVGSYLLKDGRQQPGWFDAQTIFTGIIAFATVVYTVGTFCLWRTTKNMLVLNVLLGLHDQNVIRPSGFLRLARQLIP